MAVLKIISGGQTGADQGGLYAAESLGIETGGWIPFGWRTEDGAMPGLARFGLKQHPFSGYHHRTRLNVRDSQATVIFGDIEEAGSKLTMNICIEFKRPFNHIEVTSPFRKDARIAMFQDWLKRYNVEVLNVAGNRESKNPGIQRWVHDFLIAALEVK